MEINNKLRIKKDILDELELLDILYSFNDFKNIIYNKYKINNIQLNDSLKKILKLQIDNINIDIFINLIIQYHLDNIKPNYYFLSYDQIPLVFKKVENQSY